MNPKTSTTSNALDISLNPKFKKSLTKTGVLSARALHELPNHIHIKLAQYLPADELVTISQLNNKLRKIYPKLAYEQCLICYSRSSTCGKRLVHVKYTVFEKPDKFRWFPSEHVKTLLFDSFSLLEIQKLNLPYIHISLYFPRLRNVAFKKSFAEMTNSVMPVFATAPNVFVFSEYFKLRPSSYDNSIRFLDVHLYYDFPFTNFDRFPNLTTLKISIHNDDNKLKERVDLFKSLQFTKSIKYLTLQIKIGEHFPETLKYFPSSLIYFKLTLLLGESGFNLIDYDHGTSTDRIDLSQVTHLEFGTPNVEGLEHKVCSPTFSKHYFYHTPKLKSLCLSHGVGPGDFDHIHDRFSFITTLFLNVRLGIDRWLDFAKLESLTRLKNLTVSLTEDPNIEENYILHIYSVLQIFMSDVRDKCWSTRCHSLNISPLMLKKLNDRVFYQVSPELLYGCLLKSSKDVVTEYLSDEVTRYTDWEKAQIMKQLNSQDIFKLAQQLASLEYLQVFSTSDILNNIQLLPLVYGHKTLKYLVFTDSTQYSEHGYIPSNTGIDRNHMIVEPTGENNLTYGVVDVEGIRNKCERKKLNFKMDFDHFELLSPLSEELNIFGYSSSPHFKDSLFDDRVEFLENSNGTEEMD